MNRMLNRRTHETNTTGHLAREEARFREAEWNNYLHHGPHGQSDYIITDSCTTRTHSDAEAYEVYE